MNMNQVMITPTNDTIEVARSLVGQNFIILASDEVKRARIVETEAYLGHDDPACHTFGGRRTPRTEPMYGRFGEAYVYLIYGMYHCLNFVTGRGEAVLIRALEPLEGFTEDQKQRKVLSGPGRLCRELEITRSLNHQSLLDSQTQIHLDEKSPSLKGRLLEGSRVGVNYAGDAAHWPLRFGLEGSSFISKPFSKDHFGL